MNSIYLSEQPRSDQWRQGYINSLVYPLDSGRGIATPAKSVEFAEAFELELARALDERGIAWTYKPRTFAVEWDEDGNFVDSFTPAFFIPSHELFLEPTSADSRLFGETSRKVRLLRHQYPAIKVEVLPIDRSIQIVDLASLAQAN